MAYRDTIIATARRSNSDNGVPPADYYEGGHRVIRDGVPCKVFYNATKEQRVRLAAIEIARDAGVPVELEDAPSFSFIPSESKVYKATGAKPVPAKPTSGAGKAFYEGRKRYVVGGVPTSLAFSKGNHSLRHWADLTQPMGGFEKWQERAEEWWVEVEGSR